MDKDSVADSPGFSKTPAPDLSPINPASRSAGEIRAFRRYAPARLSLPVSFEVPETWGVSEEQGRQYKQVLLLGPRNVQDTYNAGVVVRVMPSKSRGGEYDTLQELLAWRRTQHTRSASSAVLAEQPVTVAGMPGVELRYQHDAKLPRGGNPQGAVPTTIKGHSILLAHGEQLVELEYSASAEDFHHYHQAFSHLVESLALTP